MFTRIVEVTVRPESRDTLINLLNNEVLPTLRKEKGFVDSVGLTSPENGNQLLSITFWKTRQDADTYHQNTYPRLLSLLNPHITHPPTIRTYDVVTSTVHKIAAGKAA
jgi:quinol monooxygenase YgiN